MSCRSTRLRRPLIWVGSDDLVEEYDRRDDTERLEEMEACREECGGGGSWGWRAFAATEVLDVAAAADQECAWFAYARSNLALLTLTLVCEDWIDLTVAMVLIEESEDRRDVVPPWRISGENGGVEVGWGGLLDWVFRVAGLPALPATAVVDRGTNGVTSARIELVWLEVDLTLRTLTAPDERGLVSAM